MKRLTENLLLWPWGTTAWLPEDCRRLRAAEETLRRLFNRAGAGEIALPAFDFAGSIERGYGHAERLFRFTDSDGSLLALRPEMTTPAARLYATSFAAGRRAVKLFYIGQVFRQGPRHHGLFREFRQVGFECFGGRPARADAEVIALAGRSLEQLGYHDAVIEIGNVAIVEALLNEHRLTGASRALVIRLLRQKNKSGLEKAGAPRAFIGLLDLDVDLRAFSAARRLSRDKTFQRAVNDLEKLARRVRRAAKRVLFEFAAVRGIDYYTGTVFEGFIPGVGHSVLSGGRYDNLVAQFGPPTPATGFSLELESLLRR